MIAAMALGAFAFSAAAFAAPAGSVTMLGVDESTAVALGPEVPVQAKFTTQAPIGVETHGRLLAPAAKKAEKRAAKKAIKKVARKVTKSRTHAKKAAKPRKAVKAKATSSKGRWKSARVSWYGPGFYGHGMAGGGKLQKNSMVLAHRTLPFGTKVRVLYKGRSVIAVVKDRGPFIAGRTFDLGPGTAKSLGFSGVGTIKYRIVR